MAEFKLAPGMRNTRQRRLTYEAVRKLGSHHTAEEIFAELQRSGSALPRSTVYRALEALTYSGAVRTVRLGQGPTYFESATHVHQHAVCERCGGILHLEHELVSELETHLTELHRFKPRRTEVLVIGTCETCARGEGHSSPGRRTIDHVHYEEK